MQVSQRYVCPSFFELIFSIDCCGEGRYVSSDVRNFVAHRIRSFPPRDLLHHLYPRLLALHDLDDKVALPQVYTADNPNYNPAEGGAAQYQYEKIELPSLMRNSHYFMEASGIYLIGEFSGWVL